MDVGVVGAGYVGLTVSACLAKLGHRVTCVEREPQRLAALRRCTVPFYEPGLVDLLARHIGGNVYLSDDLGAVTGCRIVFAAVGTPPKSDGEPDLSALDDVIGGLLNLRFNGILTLKSTVPVGTTERVERTLIRDGLAAQVACNPEFLREGTALNDFFHPARILIGSHSDAAVETLRTLYADLNCPVMVTDPRTAEMVKYASNAFLATKVSFINEVAVICEEAGVDVQAVAEGMGLDPRIGPHFLNAGIGFGGSCLPKDLRALVAAARAHGIHPALLETVLEVNALQPERFVARVEGALGGLVGRTVAVLGLAFKSGTSDVRESPALAVVCRLLAAGAVVQAYDPAAEEEAMRQVPTLACCPTPYEAVRNADAVLILTDWQEFETLDWGRLRGLATGNLVVDGRGLDGARRATDQGLVYVGPSTPVPGRLPDAAILPSPAMARPSR